MLGLLGLLGALFAGVMAESLIPAGNGRSDDEDDGQNDEVVSETAELNNIFSMLSQAAPPSVDTSPDPTDIPDGVYTSDDTPPVTLENLQLTGSETDEILSGGAGADTITGEGGTDMLAGGAGNDLLTSGAGNDGLNGGSGADLLFGGAGDDLLIGEAGADRIEGGAGTDSLRGGDGNDTLFGDAGDDELVGGEGDDLLSGGDGDDALEGGYGDDLLIGGNGADELEGGYGNDTLLGQSADGPDGAADFLNGGDGDDLLLLGAGDYGHGGAGRDSFELLNITHGDPPAQITDFDPETDQLVVYYDATLHSSPQLTTETNAAGTTLLLDGIPLVNIANLQELDPGSIELRAA